TSDDVQNDVDAVPIGNLFDPSNEILCAVVNALRPQELRIFDLGVGAGSSNRMPAHGFNHLNCHRANTTGPTVNEHTISGLEGRSHEDVKPHCCSCFDNTGGFMKI